VQSVTAVPDGANVRVEITLSTPVKPSVDTAFRPDRILLDLPDTICDGNTKKIAVNANGVRRVRAGQHSTTPLITRVILDLDQAHSYTLKTEENRIVLTVGPAATARSSHGAPAAAASGSLIGVFRRNRQTVAPLPGDDPTSGPLAAPPETAGPAFEPPSNREAAEPLPQPPAASTAHSEPAAATPQASAAQGSLEQHQIAAPLPSRTAAVPPAATGFPAPDATAPAAGQNAGPELKNGEPDATASTIASVAPAATAPANAPASAAATVIARDDDPSLRTVFKVKYVAEGVAYLEGGRAQGLAEGMKLEVEDTNLPAKQGDSASSVDPRVVAELEVTAVAETSAVTDIHAPKRPVKVGDLAYLSSGDAEAMVQQRALSPTRQYPAVISFTEDDTLDEEAREEIPRPPLPSVNRARGRIGFDSIETISHGTSNLTSTDVGMVFRGDITRIGGTYWNLSGYWRGRLTKESAASQQTLQNLINRTYHLNMTYDNPNSTFVAGFGRLYLPWAPSLDTIDGGYFGTRLSKGTTLGIFGGSTPDPSSWDYSPNRAIGGTFINFEGGEYNGFHYSSTVGAGVSMVKWSIDRPFVFLEDSVSYNRDIAIYESAQLDSPKGNSVAPSPGPGLGRNFFNLRVNPHPRVELDFNYNYFRDIPTFDTTLVGTGLLDKYLFQGFSAGGRVEVWNQIWLSTNLGRSSGTGDAKTSLNQMYGITFGRLPWVNLRADLHYARFASSFGTGSYQAFSLSRQMSDRLRLEVLMGQQNFASPLTTNNRGRFVTGTVETTLGPHYYLQGNFTTNRGDMSYDQVMFSIGYRFDSKRKGE
jgi:AMIN domain-containing protein